MPRLAGYLRAITARWRQEQNWKRRTGLWAYALVPLRFMWRPDSTRHRGERNHWAEPVDSSGSSLSCSSSCRVTSLFTSRLDRDFDDALAAFSKELIGLCNPVKRERMGQKWSQIQTSLADQFHQSAHAFFPTGTKSGDDLVVA